jgi:hypothetical protein
MPVEKHTPDSRIFSLTLQLRSVWILETSSTCLPPQQVMLFHHQWWIMAIVVTVDFSQPAERVRQIWCALEGPVMVKARSASLPVSVDAVIDSLRAQGLPFLGPFRTPGKRTVFVVEDHILLESELVDLFGQNKLNREGIQELAERIEATAPRRLQ